jgi:hypothetical protein
VGGAACVPIPQGAIKVPVDIDGDGQSDLLVLTQDGFSNLIVTLYSGQPGGAFTCYSTGVAIASNVFAVIGYPSIPAQFVVGDFTGDGRPDVFLVAAAGPMSNPPSSKPVRWLVISDPKGGSGLTTISTNPGFILGVVGSAVISSTSDADGDGNLDVTLSLNIWGMGEAKFTQSLVVYGNGDGTFRCINSETVYCPEYCTAMAAVASCGPTGVFGTSCTQVDPSGSCLP